MRARLQSLENRVRLAAPIERSRRFFLGDGERWQETTFDYSADASLASLGWRTFSEPRLSTATLENLERSGIEVVRAFVSSRDESRDESEDSSDSVDNLH